LINIESYDNLVRKVARRYMIEGMEHEDIVQELYMELMRLLNDYKDTSGASVSTLFIRYARYWASHKLGKQFAKKRGKLILSLDDQMFEDKDVTWIDTIPDTSDPPDVAEEKERLNEAIINYLSRDKHGHIVFRSVTRDESFTSIAKEENVSVEAISKRYDVVIKKLREHLFELGYVTLPSQ
jgi:RNA polymerase sigma factor (sigma-70 family)